MKVSKTDKTISLLEELIRQQRITNKLLAYTVNSGGNTIFGNAFGFNTIPSNIYDIIAQIDKDESNGNNPEENTSKAT